MASFWQQWHAFNMSAHTFTMWFQTISSINMNSVLWSVRSQRKHPRFLKHTCLFIVNTVGAPLIVRHLMRNRTGDISLLLKDSHHPLHCYAIFKISSDWGRWDVLGLLWESTLPISKLHTYIVIHVCVPTFKDPLVFIHFLELNENEWKPMKDRIKYFLNTKAWLTKCFAVILMTTDAPFIFFRLLTAPILA